MADQTHTAETGTNNAATASIVEATKGVFVNDCLTRAVVLNTKLEKASRGVMLALATYANTSQHRAWASVPSLARRAGYSQRTTQQQLRELERLGYIHSIKDEVTRVTTTYQIVTSKLLRELCGTAAGAPSVACAKTAPGGEILSGGGEILAPGGVKSSHPKKEGIEEGFEEKKEEGGNAHAHATPLASLTTAATFPPLPSSIFENLSFARMAPAPQPAPVAPTPAPAPLPTSASPAAEPQPAPAPPPSVDTLIDLPQPPSSTATAAPAPADTLPADTIGQINAQRQRNGKGKLTQRDLTQLTTEATKAGITTVAAAQWVLAKPGRNFFRADYYKPEAAPAAAQDAAPSATAIAAQKVLASMIPPAPQTDAEKAAAAQAGAAARARIPEQRAALESKLAGTTPASRVNGPKNLFAAITGTTQPATSAAAVEPWQALPETGGTAWAAQAINAYMRGEPVGFAKLGYACQALKTSRATLQARRAALQAATTA